MSDLGERLWKSALITAVAILSLGFAPAPFKKPDTVKEDLQKMQGAWDRLSCTFGSIPPVPKPLNDVVTIKGNTISYGPNFDWVLILGNDKGVKTFEIQRKAGEKAGAWIGIYELKGDSLQVCFTPSNDRPKSIQPTKPGQYLRTTSAEALSGRTWNCLKDAGEDKATLLPRISST